MQHTMEWFDETQQVLVVQYESIIDWNEFHSLVDEVYKKVRTSSHAVDLLMWHKTGHLPGGNPILHFRSVINRQPANIRRVVVVSPDINSGLGKYMVVIAKILTGFMPKANDILLTGSYEEACELLGLKQPMQNQLSGEYVSGGEAG